MKKSKRLALRRSLFWACGFRIEAEYEKNRRIEKVTLTREKRQSAGNLVALGMFAKKLFKQMMKSAKVKGIKFGENFNE